jgi:hypothetical protein
MIIDAARVLRASRVRVGPMRVSGAPAILLGVAAVILSAGVARSLGTLAPMLPETLRETKNLIETAKRDGRLLTP